MSNINKYIDIKALSFLSVFFFSAQPCNLFSLTTLTKGNYFAVLPIFFTVLALLKCGESLLSKRYLQISTIIAVWSIALKFMRGVPISPYPFIEIYLAEALVRLYGKDFFGRFVDLSYKLSIIAIVGFVLTNIDYRLIRSVADAIGDDGAGISQSLYVYSISLDPHGGYLGLCRNSGYCWEPGRFACFVIIAHFIYMLQNGLNWKDRKNVVFTIALLSSMSTTGYIVFFIMIVAWYVMADKLKVSYVTMASVLFFSSLSLPFMREKIVDLMVTQEDMITLQQRMDYSVQNNLSEGNYCPQRFQAFMWQIQNFKNAPVLTGEGRNYENFYLNRVLGYNLVLSEGILGVFVRFGWILALSLYYLLYRSSLLMRNIFDNKFAISFIIIFTVMNFSYYLWECPILMCIIMAIVLVNNKKLSYGILINNNSNIQ